MTPPHTKNTQVLWPAMKSYYELMVMREEDYESFIKQAEEAPQ